MYRDNSDNSWATPDDVRSNTSCYNLSVATWMGVLAKMSIHEQHRRTFKHESICETQVNILS